MPRVRLSRLTCVARMGAVVALSAACGADPAPAAQQQPASAPGSSSSSVAATRVVVGGLDLTSVGYDRGDPRAPIVIVDLSDFGCGYCARHALETLPSLDREYIATGKVFYKYVPFVMGMFPNGELAARAAECAGEQDRFWPMHDSVYARQRDWKRGSDPNGVFTTLARQVVPDPRRWAACYSSDRRAERTRAANQVAGRLGVRATPTFFVNGQLVEGALPLDVLRGGLNTMLRELGAR